ncbi:MAG: hypothetical protein K2Y37_19290 [Pirellulales bacterium]|nr:hypothetical protein [Pirellulales bacterium]
MRLDDALAEIALIRRQLARVEVYRGVRAAPVACTGLIALAAGSFQALTIGGSPAELSRYLATWCAAAGVNATLSALAIALRLCEDHSPLARQATWLLVEQFLPCVAAGALVTLAIAATAPGAAWMLPGCWQVLFSLGVFAIARQLPRAGYAIALFYLLAGAANLGGLGDLPPLSPWRMAIPFAIGQGLSAVVLYVSLERRA